MTKRRQPEGPGVRLRRFIETPKGYMTAALTLLTGLGLIGPSGPVELTHALVAVGVALTLDAGIAWALKRRIPFSVGGLITGLLVADILSSLTPLLVVAATTGVAIATKHLVKRGRKPLFNPAAAGLLISALLFHTVDSWWASLPLLPVWAIAGLAAVGLLVASRVQKLWAVFAFLGSYFAWLGVMAVMHLGLPTDTPGDALRVPFVNAALFFACFMLTDPPTSPAADGEQAVVGTVAAGVAAALFAFQGGFLYLLVGLLTGNGLTQVWAWHRRVQSRAPHPRAWPRRETS